MSHDPSQTLRSEICQFLDGFRPKDPLTVAQWAERHRYLEKGTTAKPGRYSFDAGPYQREPQESYTDPTVQTTVLMWASRTGKTETLNNLDGYIIDHDPKSILVVYPTLESAMKWRKEFFNPMVRATPRLRSKINIQARHQDNTLLSMKFPGGHIAAIGANSPSGFRQIQAPVVRCDEIDAMEEGKEGDPVGLAFRRADNYPDSTQVLSSTPTIKGHSRIESWMERSDYRMWFCPCVKCGTFQVLQWQRVEWPEGRTEEARYVCENPECRYPHSDPERREMVTHGEWRPTRPFNGIRGYWLNGLNTLFPAKKGFVTKLHQMAAEYIEAKAGGEPTLKTWTNTFLAEPFDPTTEDEKPPEWKPIHERREDYGLIVPKGGLFLTAFADVQKNRIEVGWRAWGREEESWGMDYVVLDGYTGHPQVWHELRREFARKWKHVSGAEMTLGLGFVDGGAYSEAVLAFFQDLAKRPVEGVSGRVFASKGFGKAGMLIVSRGKLASIAKNGLKGRHIGTWQAKDIVYDRLRAGLDAERGRMHYNRQYDEGYFKGLTIETATKVYEAGDVYNTYCDENVTGNEPLDIEVGCLAALRLRPRKWDELEAALIDSIKEGPAPEPVRQASAIGVAGGGWRL